MNFTLYKPNSKNQGSAFSFSINKGKNDKPVLFVSMIQQYSWNDSRKTGSFKENAKNPEKSATTALSLIEAGEILSSFKNNSFTIGFFTKNLEEKDTANGFIFDLLDYTYVSSFSSDYDINYLSYYIQNSYKNHSIN